jgi:transglutaminase-like putative cysteine protease
LTIALPLNVDAISAAATNQTNTDQNSNLVSTAAINQTATNTLNKTANNSKSQVSKVKNSSTQNYAAAGTAKTVSTTSNIVSLNSIISVSTKLKNYVLTYKKLPNYVTISGVKFTMPQMLFLLSAAVIKLKSGSKTSMKVGTIKAPSTNATETAKTGNLTKASYLSDAATIYNYINKYKTVPSTFSTPLGKLRYESFVFAYSKIVSFYGTNKRLPNTVAVVPLMKTTVKNNTTSTSSSASAYVPTVVPDSLKTYLQATNNCQADNAAIKTLAASITKGINTPLARATAIYNWVRDNISYSFYYNTKYGALGTLNARTGNCVDTAHLMIALERAAGMPAKYEHVTAQFSSGTWYGHVIALVYVNGVWYKADGTSYRNSFGVVNNWNTKTATVHGTYLTLPF